MRKKKSSCIRQDDFFARTYPRKQSSKVFIDERAVVGIFHRLCKIVALNDVATECVQTEQVLFRFHALLRNLHAQFFYHADHAFQQRLIAFGSQALAEEELVEFDFVHGDRFQDIIRRIARAEVVDRTKQAVRVHRIDDIPQKFVIFIREAFGKFQRDEIVFDIEFLFDTHVIIGEIRLNCRDTGNVDGNGITNLSVFDAFGDIFAGFIEDEVVELDDKAVLLEDG